MPGTLPRSLFDCHPARLLFVFYRRDLAFHRNSIFQFPLFGDLLAQLSDDGFNLRVEAFITVCRKVTHVLNRVEYPRRYVCKYKGHDRTLPKSRFKLLRFKFRPHLILFAKQRDNKSCFGSIDWCQVLLNVLSNYPMLFVFIIEYLKSFVQKYGFKQLSDITVCAGKRKREIIS